MMLKTSAAASAAGGPDPLGSLLVDLACRAHHDRAFGRAARALMLDGLPWSQRARFRAAFALVGFMNRDRRVLFTDEELTAELWHLRRLRFEWDPARESTDGLGPIGPDRA